MGFGYVRWFVTFPFKYSSDQSKNPDSKFSSQQEAYTGQPKPNSRSFLSLVVMNQEINQTAAAAPCRYKTSQMFHHYRDDSVTIYFRVAT